MKTKRFWKRLILPVVLALGIAAFFLYQRYLIYFNVKFTPAPLTESSALLKNPYQGFYHIYGYRLTEDSKALRTQISQSVPKDDNELVLLEINLEDYRETELPEQSLAALDTIFSQWADAGKQLIVRFLYDWNGQAMATEPADISLILTHMEQTAAIVNQHTDSIYLLQGIFVGNVGEMNNSNYMSEADMCRLTEHLAAVTDPCIYLSVRTPQHLRIITDSLEPLSRSQAFSGSLQSRLGLFNDALLGSADDLGTYGAINAADAVSPADKWTRSDEISFQQHLCAFVPNGGEVVLENPLNDLDAAISYFSDIHISYLNMDYDSAVLEKWKHSTYDGEGCFQSVNGYDYMQAHLGYRYVLRDAMLTSQTPYDEAADFTVILENAGFAVSYYSFPVQLHILNTQTMAMQSISIETDTRFWENRCENRFSAVLPIRALGEGSYELYLEITDTNSGRQILLGNDLPLTEHGYRLGTFEITKPF